MPWLTRRSSSISAMAPNYGLDPIGARLWEALQAGECPAAICPALLDIYDVTPERLEADLRELLADLVANDLVEPA